MICSFKSGRGGLAVLTLAPMLAACAGCGVRVQADARLTNDSSLWSRLDGPRYAIRGASEPMEASLLFENAADMLQRALQEEHALLHRVPPSQPADLILSINFVIQDLGTGVTSYPVYAHSHGYVIHGGHVVSSYGAYGPVGTEVETYHLGFARTLSVAAWVPDPSRPAGRRTIWEGSFTNVGESPRLETILSYLTLAAGSYYGQSGHETMKFHSHDERLETVTAAGAHFGPATAPANEPMGPQPEDETELK